MKCYFSGSGKPGHKNFKFFLKIFFIYFQRFASVRGVMDRFRRSVAEKSVFYWRTPLALCGGENILGEIASMGKLFEMPSVESRNRGAAVHSFDVRKPQAAVMEIRSSHLPFDLNLWLCAPRERNRSYIPVYSSIAYAMQTALRGWVAEWLSVNPDAIERRISGYSLLAFSCTRPYRGRTTNLFTYDVQQT